MNKQDEALYKELVMLTGDTNKDLYYLTYLLVKDGIMFKEQAVEYSTVNENTVPSFAEWFDSIEEV